MQASVRAKGRIGFIQCCFLGSVRLKQPSQLEHVGDHVSVGNSVMLWAYILAAVKKIWCHTFRFRPVMIKPGSTLYSASNPVWQTTTTSKVFVDTHILFLVIQESMMVIKVMAFIMCEHRRATTFENWELSSCLSKDMHFTECCLWTDRNYWHLCGEYTS